MSSPYLRISSSEVSLADKDGLAEELIARMALYDAALAESADPTFLETAPLSLPLPSRWRQLKSCLRLLHDIYPPSPPVLHPGEPSGMFGRFRIRREIGRGAPVGARSPDRAPPPTEGLPLLQEGDLRSKRGQGQETPPQQSMVLWTRYSAALIAYYPNRRRPGFAAPRF